MKTGYCGTFVISWSQTEIDGQSAASLQSLNVGSAWCWTGEAIRVDGPNTVLRLDVADGAENLRKRAAHMVHRLVGAALDRESSQSVSNSDPLKDPLMDGNFVVTDGAQTYTVTLIEVAERNQRLLMFIDDIPPKGRELWVVQHTLDKSEGQADGKGNGGVICFTPGTRIQTPKGMIAIEHLREGDQVQTKDNGAQDVQWIGARRMSGARLFAMPELRPVRFLAGSLGSVPDEELLVSPHHRILLQGDAARDLFNTPEVLIAAKDLVNGNSIRVDHNVREVTYVHLLLENHQVLWANGVETESFHPASAALATLNPEDRARLLAAHPELEHDPHTYGNFARRNLSASEAAIWNHAA